MKYIITDNNLFIPDSYLVAKKYFQGKLNSAKALHPNSDVWKRSFLSMKLEWATHNGLYACHLWRSQTKDVDLNYPQKWYEKVGYSIFGTIFWLFIK